MTVREASRMTLQEIVTLPGWLYELRKPALLRICYLCLGYANHSMTIEVLVNKIVRAFTVWSPRLPVRPDPDAVVTLLHDANFLQQITIHGLKLLCATQHLNINENKDTMIRGFLMHIPLKITLEHGDWTKQVVVKRCNNFANFLYTEFFSARHMLMVDGLLAPQNPCCLSTLNINDGSVLKFLNTPDAPQDSSCKSLNEIDISNRIDIENYRTIERIELISGDCSITSCCSTKHVLF